MAVAVQSTKQRVPQATLILGKKASGKSTQAQAEVADLKAITILGGNAAGLLAQEDASYIMPSAKELDQIVDTIASGRYEAVVVDGLYQLAQIVLVDMTGESSGASQQQWQIMGLRVTGFIQRLMSIPTVRKVVLVTSTFRAETTGEEVIDLNPDLERRIMGLASQVIYTAALVKPNEAPIFTVQRNSTLAARFIPALPEPTTKGK